MLIGKTVNVFGGANLLAHDTRSLPDPLGVPAGITAAASPTAAWAGNTIYRNVSVSGGTGKGLRVDIRTDTDGVPTVMLRDPGTGYTVGDVLTVSEPKTGSVSTITVTVSRLLERGGDITLAAADVFAAWNYGPSDAKAALTIHDGAGLKGRDVELLAEASNNDRQISVDALNPADTPNTGDKILDILRQLRLFVGVQESEAIATVTVNAATIEAVGGNVRTTADARSAASSLPVGAGVAVSYATSNAESTVTINTGATITALAGDVTLLSLNNNTVSSKPTILKSEALKKTKVFEKIGAIVSVAEITQQATTTVASGAVISSHGDVLVIADAERSLTSIAKGKNRNVNASFAVSYAKVAAEATATVNGIISSSAGGLSVLANTTATTNSVTADFWAGNPQTAGKLNSLAVVALYGSGIGSAAASDGAGDLEAPIVGLFTQLISLSPTEKTQSVSSTSPRAGEGVERLAVFSIAVTLQESTATARIGSQADVNAADRVRVLSDAYDLPSLSASATANIFLYPKETSSAKTTIAVGVQYGAFSNTSLAEIAGGAQVDAAGEIVVN